jgi:catalase
MLRAALADDETKGDVTMKNDTKPTTTDAGIPVPSDEFSLTVGPDGPILLQDHYTKAAAYTRRKDDDWAQAGPLVRKVIDDAARSRLVSNVVGHLSKRRIYVGAEGGFVYWRNIDKEVGDRSAGMNANVRISPREERITTSAKKHTSTRLQ